MNAEPTEYDSVEQFINDLQDKQITSITELVYYKNKIIKRDYISGSNGSEVQYTGYLMEAQLSKKKVKELEKLYDTLDNQIENIIFTTDNLIAKKKTKKNFIYYPETIDSFFNQKIYKKKEFNINELNAYSEKAIQVRNMDSNFKITNTQSFVKTFLSEETPYKGLLLWHGVGVGKTCAAISIAENFIYKQVNILLPSNTLKQNWKDEIINIKKELYKKKNSIVQCTGNTYIDKLDIDYWKQTLDKDEKGEYDIRKLKLTKRINKVISEHYTFTTYMTLANSIEKDFKKIEKKSKGMFVYSKQIQYIKERFSDQIYIMDEIHQTRSNGGISETENKKIRPFLEMIARYAMNTHFILLSATPMYNITDEIRWILNLLLWNDGRGAVPENIFDANGLLLRPNTADINYEHILINKSRGYISHLRGENPYTFPIKLTPYIEGRDEEDIFLPTPFKYIEKGTIKKFSDVSDDMSCFKHIERVSFLYPDIFSKWQYSFIETLLLKKKKLDLTTIGLLVKYSNIMYPVLNDDGSIDNTLMGTIKDGFNKFSNYKYEYLYDTYPFMKISDTDDTDTEPLLLKKHSIKIYNIIKSIQASHPIVKKGYKKGAILKDVEHPGGGIVFIYSKLRDFGIKPTAFALEELGMNRYVLHKDAEYMGDNLLIRERDDNDRFCAFNKCSYKDIPDDKIHTFIQARYIYLDGSIPKPTLNLLVKEARGEGVSNQTNTYGENILVILGTRVVEVGISFFNVRQIHLLEPWFHFNEMIQVVGRGSRNFSHKSLQKEHRNLMVYLHVGTQQEMDRVETVDEKLYRDSYCKKKNMIQVELLLKENAIDCQLNKKGNLFIENKDGEDSYYEKGSLHMDIYDSIRPIKRNKRFVGDEDYSLSCNLQKCREFTCTHIDISEEETIDTSTFSQSDNARNVNQSKILIKNLFTKKHFYELKDLLQTVKSDVQFFSHGKDTDVDKNLIVYSALDKIVTQKENIYYKKNEGYLIMRYINIGSGIQKTEAAFYIFQPKIITRTNVDTYESIHSKKFKKEYKKIHTKILSTQNELELDNYKKQKNNLFTKLFSKEDTTLPLSYRNSILQDTKRKYISDISAISNDSTKRSLKVSQPMKEDSGGAGAAATKVSDMNVKAEKKIPSSYKKVQSSLQKEFKKTKIDSIDKFKGNITNVGVRDNLFIDEHIIVINRYKQLDRLSLVDKKILLKYHIRGIMNIDNVSTIHLSVSEQQPLQDENETLYESLSRIYSHDTYGNPECNNREHILKMIKKHVPLAEKSEDEDIYTNILLITVYLKYDTEAASILMARLRNTLSAYFTNEDEDGEEQCIEHFNNRDFVETFDKIFKSAMVGDEIDSTPAMGIIYTKTNLQDIMYKLLIIDYYDKSKHLYNNTNKNYTIIRKRRDMIERQEEDGDGNSNEILGFVLRYSITQRKERYLFVQSSGWTNNGFDLMNDTALRHLRYNKEILFDNKNILMGLSMYNPKSKEVQFKLLNNITVTKKTKSGKLSLKEAHTGVVCKGGPTVTSLIKDLNKLLKLKGDNKLKKKPSVSTNKLTKEDLCELLSLLLRYNEYKSLFVLTPLVQKITKYFYNIEQALYLTF
jgi:hypothetical protein